MRTNKELAMRKFVDTHTRPQLFLLKLIGGKNLSLLARDIYTGFGLFPGNEEALATRLSQLPMDIIGGVPTFTYTQWGRQKPLLRVSENGIGRLLPFGLYATDGSGRFSDVPIRRTPAVDVFIDGAQRLHKAVNIHQSRANLYLHLVFVTARTANHKRLCW